MSWKSILKEDNELDERVKVILEYVEDFKVPSYWFKNREQFIEWAYNYYKEQSRNRDSKRGLNILIGELEFRQDKQNDYYHTYEHLDILNMRDTIDDLKSLLGDEEDKTNDVEEMFDRHSNKKVTIHGKKYNTLRVEQVFAEQLEQRGGRLTPAKANRLMAFYEKLQDNELSENELKDLVFVYMENPESLGR